MADKIQNAYETSKNIYDDVLTQRNIFSKLYIKLFWSGTDDNDIARKVLSYVPDDFLGNLLDVPVGTAVFTENKWSSLKNAHITCIDYSMDMLEQARKRLGSHAHIKCIQGDVGNLQMENESVDTVVSMNGFHAFPDKQKAFHEIWRVLKPGGNFIACFYIRGKSKRTDWLVKNILAKKGWFSPPFQAEKELRDILTPLVQKQLEHAIKAGEIVSNDPESDASFLIWGQLGLLTRFDLPGGERFRRVQQWVVAWLDAAAPTC